MRTLLYIDAVINLGLGVLLVSFPLRVAEALGVPIPVHPFYASVLGGVLFGIGIALMIEARRSSSDVVGLGLGGAVAINLSGGAVLTYFLLFGNLDLPLRGQVFLWGLAVTLIAISLAEMWTHSFRARPQ